MTTATLVKFLAALEPAVRDAGGAKAATDLATAREALGAFGDLTVAALAEQVRRAEHYRQTGKVPVAATKTKRKTAAADPEKVRTAALAVTGLYERAIDRDVDYGDIESELKRIEKGLSAAEAKAVAGEVHIAGKPKSKKAAFEAIKARIFDRKQSFQRTSF